MAGISLSEILHNRPSVVPTIYGYILPDLADHNGYDERYILQRFSPRDKCHKRSFAWSTVRPTQAPA